MEWENTNFLKKLNSSDLVKFKDVIYIYIYKIIIVNKKVLEITEIT